MWWKETNQGCVCSRVSMLSSRRPLRPSIAIVTVSSAIAAYLLFPDKSRSPQKPLSPSHFIPATLVRSVQTSPDTKLLTISVPPELIPQDGQQFAPIWSIFIKDDDIQVERPYTPLHGVDESGQMLFWIKKYERGEVARWLHSKQPGSSIEIRGPLKTWPWKDGTWEDIIMVTTSSTNKLDAVSHTPPRYPVVQEYHRSISSCTISSPRKTASVVGLRCFTLQERPKTCLRHP